MRLAPVEFARLSLRTILLPTVLALALTCPLPFQVESSAAMCAPHVIGTDYSNATRTLPAFFGRAWGQVFFATDTLIRTITVWRKAEPDSNFAPMKLYVTNVDSTGRPILYELLLDGPTLVVPFGDGVHPIEVAFALDPPLALPSHGYYYFAVKEANCSYVLPFLGDTLNPYPEGAAWRTEPLDPFCEGIGCCPFDFGGRIDLAFRVEFCRTDGVEVRRFSWGKLKTLYR